METATKCLATAFSSPKRLERPFAGGVGVGHRLQRRERLGRDDEQRLGGVEVVHGLGEIGAVHVGDEAERQVAVAVVLERLVGHDGAEVGAADADVDDVADALAGVALPVAAANPVGKGGHLVEDGVDRRHDVFAVHHDRRAFGARRAVCSTARFSVTLILSPRNMASMRARRPHSSARCSRRLQRLVGDAVLGVIEVEADGLGRQAFAAFGVVGEELAQGKLFDLGIVGFQRFPGGR